MKDSLQILLFSFLFGCLNLALETGGNFSLKRRTVHGFTTVARPQGTSYDSFPTSDRRVMCSLSTQCLKTSLLTQTHSSFESLWISIQCWGTQAAFGGPIIAHGSLQEIRDRSILHGVLFLFPNLKKNLGRREIRFLLSLIICARIYNSSMIYLHSLKESKVVQIIMIQ